MRTQLRDAAGLVRNFEDAYGHIIHILRKFRSEYNYPRIGYVSGVLTSDGPGRVLQNREELIRLAGVLQEMHHFPIFTLQDAFTPETLRRLKDAGHTSHHYTDFAGEILKSGFITDVFFAPRWENSQTARSEQTLAERFGLRINYIEYEEDRV
ncbi:MAG: hypothetical protein Q8R20_02665 [Nanoarchaeota archaeon]|nr:hypothetical protein [Nanoarchaeota archaeon]